MITTISLIGAGRVGAALACRCHARGVDVQQVFSRSAQRATATARICAAEGITRLDQLRPDADLYLIAVPDDAIAGVVRALAAVLPRRVLVAHTSGATPTAVAAAHFERAGIFYPLQSFAADRAVDWEQLPLCVHAAAEPELVLLEDLARRIATRVHRIDDAQRAALHVSAVFVNNFTNYLYGVGEELAFANSVPFDLLLPLIREGVDRLGSAPTQALQTGPAVRGDEATIGRHLALLRERPDLREVYTTLTRAIQATFARSDINRS